MKNSRLKKAMSIIVAFAMVLTMGISAFAEVELQALWVDEAPVFTTGSNLSAEMLTVTTEEGAVTDYQYRSTYDESKLWDGSVATEAPSTTTIDGATYYQISDGAELAWFASQVNSGSAAINAVLTDDIYLNYGETTNNWYSKQIGTIANKFAGIFDGAGYSINGMYVSASDTTTGGLFKYISGGTVKDVIMKDVNIVSSYSLLWATYTGAIAADCSGGTITGCSVSGSISHADGKHVNGVGGIVAYINNSTVSDCYSDINITANGSPPITDSGDNYYIGGIVGRANGTSTIERCGNAGTIYAPNYFDVAGVVGWIDAITVTVKECYNTGNITGKSYVAGCIGAVKYWYYPKMGSLYNTGAIRATVSVAAGLMAGSTCNGSSIARGSYSTGIVSCDTANYDNAGLAYSQAKAEEGYFIYPAFSEGITLPVGQISPATTIGTAMTLAGIKTQATVDILNGWAGANTYKIISSMNDGYPVFTWQTNSHFDNYVVGETAEAAAPVAPTVWDGSVATEAPSTTTIGEASYYQISNGAELAWFASQVNAGSTAINAILTDDIYLNYGGTYTNNWYNHEIGTNTNKFSGIFDGAGYSINGMYVSASSTTTGGLFKYISGGTVKDVVMKDVNFVSTYGNQYSTYTGAIAADCSGGTITGCSVSGSISHADGKHVNGVGGIAAFITDSTVSDCYSDINITATGAPPITDSGDNFYLGGIVGRANGTSTIERCGNAGTIYAPNYFDVAGVVGWVKDAAVTVKECYNTGNITGKSYVAGIAVIKYYQYPTMGSLYNTGAIKATMTRAAGLVAGSRCNGGSIARGSYTTGVVSCDTADDTTSGLAYSLSSAQASYFPNFIYPELDSDITWPVGSSSSVLIGEKKTLEEIKTQETVDMLNGWAGEGTYKIDSSINAGYPVFTWQTAPEAQTEPEGTIGYLFINFAQTPGNLSLKVNSYDKAAELSVYAVADNWTVGDIITTLPAYTQTAVDTETINGKQTILINAGTAANILIVSDEKVEIERGFAENKQQITSLGNNEITASIDIAFSEGSSSAVMIIALYGDNGNILKDITFGDSVTVNQIPVNVNAKIDLTETTLASGDILKAYVWNGIDSIVPLLPTSQLSY